MRMTRKVVEEMTQAGREVIAANQEVQAANIWSDVARQAALEARRQSSLKPEKFKSQLTTSIASAKESSNHAANLTAKAFKTEGSPQARRVAHIAASEAHYQAGEKAVRAGNPDLADHHIGQALNHEEMSNKIKE